MDIFKEIENKDKEIIKTLKKTKAIFLFRVGSSLHKDLFNENSDIDYIAVVEHLNINFVNNFPNKTSPNLTIKTHTENLDYFFWRVDIERIRNHRVNIMFYTVDKFLAYIEERSGAKMYLLNEHLLLYGDERVVTALKEQYRPNRDTAISDLKVIKESKYKEGNTKFLWGWRSVALIMSKYTSWLKNKQEIKEYVAKNYPGKLENKDFLIRELQLLLK